MEPSQKEKISKKVIDLTKHIHLRDPQDGSRVAKFLAGKSPWHPLLGSFAMEWWVTERGSNCCEAIADMTIASETSLSGGDREAFCDAIHKTLRENVNNSQLFNVDRILLSQSNTLFEARATTDAREFASLLWDVIYSGLGSSIDDWLILYPLHKVKARSSILGFDGLSLLDANDSGRWSQITDRYKSAKYWNPTLGTWKDENRFNFKDFHLVPTWLACEVSGTALGARNLAARQLSRWSPLLHPLDVQCSTSKVNLFPLQGSRLCHS